MPQSGHIQVKNLVASLFTLSALAAVLPASAQATPEFAPALLTSSAMAMVAIAQGPPPGGPGRGPGFGQGPTEEEKERFRVRIGITKEQQLEIDRVFRESGQQMGEIRKRSGDLTRQLYGLYDSFDFDRGQAKAIRRELLMLHKRMADIHADNEEKLRRIMSREQFERMRALVKEDWDKRRKAWDAQRARGGARP